MFRATLFSPSGEPIVSIQQLVYVTLCRWPSGVQVGARWGWVVKVTPRALYPQERPVTPCIGGWVGSRAGLDGCGRSRLHRDSIPGPSRPTRVSIPTELSRPTRDFPYFLQTDVSECFDVRSTACISNYFQIHLSVIILSTVLSWSWSNDSFFKQAQWKARRQRRSSTACR
jgi:hypothetical protein